MGRMSSGELHDLRFGNGDDESAAAALVVLLALDDFGSEVPGENQSEIGLVFEERVGRADGQPGAGGDFVLFEGGVVNDVVEVIGSQAAGIEQGVAFGRGPIA